MRETVNDIEKMLKKEYISIIKQTLKKYLIEFPFVPSSNCHVFQEYIVHELVQSKYY